MYVTTNQKFEIIIINKFIYSIQHELHPSAFSFKQTFIEFKEQEVKYYLNVKLLTFGVHSYVRLHVSTEILHFSPVIVVYKLFTHCKLCFIQETHHSFN